MGSTHEIPLHLFLDSNLTRGTGLFSEGTIITPAAQMRLTGIRVNKSPSQNAVSGTWEPRIYAGGVLVASGPAVSIVGSGAFTLPLSSVFMLQPGTTYTIGVYGTGVWALREWNTLPHDHVASDDGYFSVSVSGNRYRIGNGEPTTSAAAYELSQVLLVRHPNDPPNAPILDVPSTVNRNLTNRFSLTASDPDPGDSTSQTDWRYRIVGTSTWTTVSKVSPNTWYDFIAGTFLAGDYEIQARTVDAAGNVGPWSSSSFFTAADAPDQPTWVDPINGQTISTESYTGTISAPSVDESEWRLVADNAGVIDEATVLHGPVLKTTGDVRSHTFTGLTNGVTVWWQARTKFGGLWSQWAAVRTPVAYTPPPVPTFEQTPDNATGSLLIDVTNPAPVGDEPAVSYNDVLVDEVRLATFVPPNGSWRWMLPPSGFAGAVTVRAYGTNGTSTSST